MCCSKKGVSALQISRELGVTYKTAWFMCHRIREAMSDDCGILGGEVEVDETYVGGKPRKGTGVHKRGHGSKKVPVVALVEKDGRAKAYRVTAVSSANLKGAVYQHVDPSAIITTDELSVYHGLIVSYRDHLTVNHGRGEYVGLDGRTTNTVESYFALLKRGVYGTFHNVSPKHLTRYCNEFSFRWNHRKVSDETRTLAAIRGAEGKDPETLEIAEAFGWCYGVWGKR
jgi:transposase-like protein